MALMGVAILSSGLTYAMIEPTESPNTTDSESFAMGHVTATLRDADGNIKAYRQTDNLIVNTGFDMLAVQIFGNATGTGSTITGIGGFNNGGTVKAMAIGTGNAAAAATQVDLQTYDSGCANKTATFAESTTTTGTDKINMETSVTFQGTAGCDINVNEAGLFSNVDGKKSGDMFARQQFTQVAVGANDSLTLNWDVTLGV